MEQIIKDSKLVAEFMGAYDNTNAERIIKPYIHENEVCFQNLPRFFVVDIIKTRSRSHNRCHS